MTRVKNDWGNSVIETSDGGYLIAGHTDWTDDPLQDMFETGNARLMKTDSTGKKQWSHSYGGDVGDWANSVIETSDGGYLFAGITNQTADGNDGSVTTTKSDAWLVRVDSSATKQWEHTFEEITRATSVIETSDGGYLIVGQSDINESSGSNAWLVKLSSDATSSSTVEPTKTTVYQPTVKNDTTTRTTSVTSLAPTTLSDSDYSLENGTKLEVDVGYTKQYIITDIPDTDSSRCAVTNMEYELVSPATARDALLAETYARKGDEQQIFRYDLNRAKEVRSQLKIQEYVNRAGDISLSLLQSYALAHLSPLAAVPEAVDAMAETIDWTVDELNDPYKQSFTALANSSKNLRWMDAKSSGIRSTAEFTDDIQYLVNKSVGLVSLVNDVDDISTAWKQVITAAASSSDEVAQSLYTKVSITAAKGLAGMFVNIALDHTLEPMENWFRMNAEIASLMHAYNTVRIPVLKELIAVEKRAQNASLTPTDFIRYHAYRFTLQQLRALAFSYSARRYRGAIQGGRVKGLLTVLDNGAEKMNTHTRIAENGRRRAMWEFAGLGAGWSDVDRKLTNSINMEAYETRNGGNR